MDGNTSMIVVECSTARTIVYTKYVNYVYNEGAQKQMCQRCYTLGGRFFNRRVKTDVSSNNNKKLIMHANFEITACQ